MSPEEIRVVVDTAIRDGLRFPWWSYVLAVLLPVGGAYIGSYAKRKAEDRATQENFDSLREQLRKTTQDTVTQELAHSATVGYPRAALHELAEASHEVEAVTARSRFLLHGTRL